MLSRPRLQTASAAALVLFYFFYNAGAGLFAGFTQDDILNLSQCWTTLWWTLFDSCVVFLAPAYRPLGSLFYRSVFALAGLHPFPYRAICFAILLVNMGLLYAFVKRLSGSRAVAVMAVLLGAFHPGMADLYFSSGSIYDLLTYTFSLGAFLYYLRIRQRGGVPDTGQTLALLALFVLALDAKEMAAVLPLLFVLWELIFHPPRLSREGIRLWLWNEGRAFFALLPVSLLQAASRISPSSPFAGNPGYHLTFTFHRYREMWAEFINQMVFQPPLWCEPRMVAVLLGALVMVTAAMRSRLAAFGLLWLLVAELPVAFLPSRGLFVLYLPFVGLQLLLALLAVRLVGTRPAARAALLVCTATVLTLVNSRQKETMLWWAEKPSLRIHQLIDDARRYPLPRRARVILLNDPFDRNEWTPVSILRLLNRDSDLDVRRQKMGDDTTARASDYVFRFDSERLVLVRAPLR